MSESDCYIIQRYDGGDIVPCDSCGCEVPTQDFEWGPPYNQTHTRENRALCEFCATTMAGNYTRFIGKSDTTYLRNEIWIAAAAVANFLQFTAKRQERGE